jgi:hypothetical protein
LSNKRRRFFRGGIRKIEAQRPSENFLMEIFG